MKQENRIEFLTSEDQHWYESPAKKGLYYPSATTILSCFPKGKGFQQYLTKQESWEASQEILKDAGKRGTNVHKGTEMLEDGITLHRESYTLQKWEMLQGFVNWYRKYQPKLLFKERGVVSDKLKTGGTIDRIYDIDGTIVVLDIKTSSAIYGSFWCQTGCYAEMVEEKLGIQVDATAILRLTQKRKDKYEYVLCDRDTWKANFKIFQAVQAIWNYENPKAKPKLVDVPLTLSL